MNYDTIILELLTRIQALEEQVAALSVQMGSSTEPLPRPAVKAGTKELRVYIETLKRAASERGESSLVLRAGVIHKEKGLKNSMPIVCNAMRQCMEAGDKVLYEPPSGYSSALEIRYLLQAGERNDSGRTPTAG